MKKFFMLIISSSFLYTLKSSWEDGYGICSETQKLDRQKAHLSTGYADQTVGRIKVYSEVGELETSGQSSKKFTGFGNAAVGVWKPRSEHPHGVEFMFSVAIDYFRCDGGRTALVTSKEEFDELDYVVTPWNVEDLPSWGWTLVADVDYVHVYQNPKNR